MMGLSRIAAGTSTLGVHISANDVSIFSYSPPPPIHFPHWVYITSDTAFRNLASIDATSGPGASDRSSPLSMMQRTLFPGQRIFDSPFSTKRGEAPDYLLPANASIGCILGRDVVDPNEPSKIRHEQYVLTSGHFFTPRTFGLGPTRLHTTTSLDQSVLFHTDSAVRVLREQKSIKQTLSALYSTRDKTAAKAVALGRPVQHCAGTLVSLIASNETTLASYEKQLTLPDESFVGGALMFAKNTIISLEDIEKCEAQLPLSLSTDLTASIEPTDSDSDSPLIPSHNSMPFSKECSSTASCLLDYAILRPCSDIVCQNLIAGYIQLKTHPYDLQTPTSYPYTPLSLLLHSEGKIKQAQYSPLRAYSYTCFNHKLQDRFPVAFSRPHRQDKMSRWVVHPHLAIVGGQEKYASFAVSGDSGNVVFTEDHQVAAIVCRTAPLSPNQNATVLISIKDILSDLQTRGWRMTIA